MKFFTRFSPNNVKGIFFKNPSLTQQHFRDECDINNIVARANVTGVMPQGTRQPLFGDFSEIPTSYLGVQEYLKNAQENFLSLPSDLRKEFDNNPAALLDFLSHDENREKAIELGLVAAPEVHSQETVVAETGNESEKN